MDMTADIIIVGAGAAGLYCALNLEEDKTVIMITKTLVKESDSFLAQGGICVLRDEKDYDSFFLDTLKAGHFENNKESVDVMIRNSPDVIKDLTQYGVDFEREHGDFKYTKEGAHSIARIIYHEDITGKEITSKLLAKVKEKRNVTILENTTMIDLIKNNNECIGIIVKDLTNKVKSIHGGYIVLATGGIGGLYENSTNYPHLTGDALAIALKNNIKLKHINYIQIHPTSLYTSKHERSFLISESVRGEGAILLNKNMERFVDELLPRDILTKKIKQQMKKDGTKYVWLSLKYMSSDRIIKRFPNIYKHCLEEGYDITKECVPVTPAQHYFMGGIEVDLDSKTSMEHLYAIGETSCNGVHGANRLASNSLLESLVFAKRSAVHITNHFKKIEIKENQIDLSSYENLNNIEEEYKEMVLREIERVEEYERYRNNEAKHG